LLALVFSFSGFMLIGSAGFALNPGARMEEVAKLASTPAPSAAFTGAWLDTIGSFFFIAFAARLWARLRAVEAAPAWMSVAAFGAALLAIAASLVDKAAFLAVFLRAGQDLDPAVAASLYDLIGGSFRLFGMFGAFTMLFASIAIVRWRALPTWIGWYGTGAGLASIALAVSPELGQLGFPLFAIWLIATSIALLLRREL
jgi:hypothetical protein